MAMIIGDILDKLLFIMVKFLLSSFSFIPILLAHQQEKET